MQNASKLRKQSTGSNEIFDVLSQTASGRRQLLIYLMNTMYLSYYSMEVGILNASVPVIYFCVYSECDSY